MSGATRIAHTTGLGEHHAPEPAAELLVVHSGDRRTIGMLIPLDGGELRLGREPPCEIVLNDPTVSRLHARLVLRGDTWWCENQSDTNPLKVNRQALTQAYPLCAGDELRLGSVVLRSVGASELKALRQMQRADRMRTVHRDLPHPLAVLLPFADAQRSPMARVKALLDGLENALRFAVAVELALVRDQAPDGVRAEAAGVLGSVRLGQALSMGAWRMLAVELARRIPALDHPATLVARAFADAGGKPRPISDRLLAAVTYRNSMLVHTQARADEAYEREEPKLREVVVGLLEGLRPLAELELVSCAGMELTDDGVVCELRRHQGPNAMFPIAHVTLVEGTTPLRKDWCYLVHPLPGAGVSPLLLAPVVAARVPEGAEQVELMLAERLVTGPKKAAVALRGVTSNQRAQLEVPWTAEIERFHGLVAEKA